MCLPTSLTPAVTLYHLRQAIRRLARERTFTLATVATLALGVGANVAVFAVVEAVLLRPLPYTNADELVILRHRDTRTNETKEFLALGDYVDLQKQAAPAFRAIAAYGSGRVTLYGEGDPVPLNALMGAAQLFDVLGVRPMHGRGFEAEDTRTGAGPVVVLGHELWRTKFNSDLAVIGRSIQVGTQQRLVIGIAPPELRFPPNATTDLILPMQLPTDAPAVRRSGWIMAMGRLAPGETVESATAHLDRLSRQFETDFPEGSAATRYYSQSLRDALVGNTRLALLLLLGAVGLVLLVACANVANLLLVRTLARRREMAVRMALGASRGRLFAQLLAESLVLSIVAGAVGLVMAHVGTRALIALVPPSVSAPGLQDVAINGFVLAFALGVVLLTTLAFGVVAALSVRTGGMFSAALATRGATAGTRARRVASMLVAGEIAMAVLLLVGAGLVLRTFDTVMRIDPGFSTSNIMTLGVALPIDRYNQDIPARQAFYTRAMDAIRALPGVRDVGVASVMPLTGNNWTQPFVRPDQPMRPGERPPDVGWQVASGGFFRALDIPLTAGRYFDPAVDRPDGNPVVIISESVRKQYFAADENPIGRMVGEGDDRAEIVGVVGDIRRVDLRAELSADMYLPFETFYGAQTTFYVASDGDPASLATPMRAALRAIEPSVTFGEAQTLAQVAAQSEGVTRLIVWLLGVFATTALLLASVGIYGVMSYIVRQRTKEFGIRLALGATRADIMRLVMTHGIAIAVAGTVTGLVVGIGAARVLRSVLFGVTSSDPGTLLVASAVLVLTAALACWIPARRAIAVDPARTLAEE